MKRQQSGKSKYLVKVFIGSVFSLFYTGLCFGVEFDFLRGYFGQRIVQSDADAALSRLRSVDPDFVPGAGRRDTDLLLREFHFHAVLRLHRRTFEQKFASRLDEDRSIGRRGVGETEIVARFGLDGELRFGIVFLEPLAAFEADYRVRERGGNGLLNRLAGEYCKVERSLVAESRAALLLRIAVADRRRIVAAGHEGGRIFAERGVFGEVFRCRGAFFTFRPQLVYVTPTACGVAFYKDFLVVQLLKLMGRKVVVHYHNKGVVTRQDKKLDDWMYRRFFKGIKVILLADALYEDVKKYVKREQVLICENGIPGNAVDAKDITRENTTPRILFLSNLLIAKGVLVLLDSLKMLDDKKLNFTCDFVGAETNEIDAQRFQEEVEMRNLQNKVAYLGKKYGEEKEDLYKKSDFFILPTLNECFPLVLLEAMQHALPCVASDVGGISSIIRHGENGYLVEMNNPTALANSIEKLLKDADLRKNMGENGWKRFKSDFTLEAFEKRMEFCLKKALK